MSDDYHLRVLVERLSRQGASDSTIERAVREATGAEQATPTERELRRPWRLLRRATI